MFSVIIQRGNSMNHRLKLVIDGLTGNQRFFLGWSQVWRGKARVDLVILWQTRAMENGRACGRFFFCDLFPPLGV